jgi:hypothetical protein
MLECAFWARGHCTIVRVILGQRGTERRGTHVSWCSNSVADLLKLDRSWNTLQLTLEDYPALFELMKIC